jgi:hypothetical protein
VAKQRETQQAPSRFPSNIGRYLLMRVVERELHDYERDLKSGLVGKVEA